MTNKEENFSKLPFKTRHSLREEVSDKLSSCIKSSGGKEWNAFTDDFFRRQYEKFPNIFENKHDLKLLEIFVDPKDLNNHSNDDFFWDVSWKFYFSLSFYGEFTSAYFSGASFYGNVDFSGAKFKCEAYFKKSCFMGMVSFNKTIFHSEAFFTQALFNQAADFSSASFFSSADFSQIRFGENASLNLSNATFAGISSRFTKNDSTEISCKGLDQFNCNQTIFETPVVFDLNFKKCPDFSECYFLKKFFIKETWPAIKDGEIKADDEEKFRFLKTYFASVGDHLKEQKYFSYEMKAVEQRKKQEKQKISSFTALFTKNFWEWQLFELYKIHSDYGMSVSKPLKGLCAFFMIFGAMFSIYFSENIMPNNPDVMTKVLACFAYAFIGTIFPLANLKMLPSHASLYSGLIFISGLQAIFSFPLLFLLALGIRNKFKIK